MLPHIVHMIDSLQPAGAERLIVDLLRHRSGRYRYSVVCLVSGGSLAIELETLGVKVNVLHISPGFHVHNFIRVLGWMLRERPDVVHTHLHAADTYGRAAALLTGVPAVFSTRHNSREWPGWFRPRLAQILGRLSTRVIACGPEIGDFLINTEHLPHEKVSIVSNGIDLARLDNASGDSFRREIGLSSDILLLGLIGRLHPQKGHQDLLAALSMLRKRGTNFHCVLVGTGALKDPIETMIRELGLADAVTCIGQRNDIPEILSALDIFVMSSHWEGLPIALLEAMAMSNAVVATSVGSIPGVITDGIDGILVQPKRPDHLAAVLGQLATDHQLRRDLGSAARHTVETRFSVRETASKYESLYDRALSGTNWHDCPQP